MLHAPTPSEEALWQALRGGVHGVAFKRQVVLGGRYIVDFFAPSVGLVVEVDGGIHRTSRAADRRRDARLHRLGYPSRSGAGVTQHRSGRRARARGTVQIVTSRSTSLFEEASPK